MPISDIAAFHALLTRQPNLRILALCGAGLSASSGLPTFRGAGGLWRNHDAVSLASPDAFAADPAKVWLFYAYRRHMALRVQPNAAHYALAALARKKDGFLCLTQNVDNLSQRAGHPSSQLHALHGNLFTVSCTNRRCGHVEHENTLDPLVPALSPASEQPASEDPSKPIPLLDPSVPLPVIDRADLPRCPECDHLTRPGVVWFGEALDWSMLSQVDDWIARGPIDIVLVVGTSAQVHPAASYVAEAERMGARACVVNPDANGVGLRDDDFAFRGDAAELLPKLLEPVIGKATELRIE